MDNIWVKSQVKRFFKLKYRNEKPGQMDSQIMTDGQTDMVKPVYPLLLHMWGGIKQKGQDGPGSLTWYFEIALANFFLSFSEKNLQEFLNVCTVQEASIH